MRNLWLVAAAEYRRMVRRRSFILATLGVPLLIAAVSAAAILIATSTEDQGPQAIGYVDQARVIQANLPADQFGPDAAMPIIGFPSEDAARTALEQGQIVAYYLLPADYRQTGQVELRFWQKSPNDRHTDEFKRFLRANLVAGLPAEQRAAAGQYININMRTLGKAGETAEVNAFAIILPLLLGMFFVFVVMGSAGYLLQAVTTEKENRMVEIMFTTVSPFQLIAGKSLGLMGVALTQIAVWLGTIAIGLVILTRSIDLPAGLGISPQFALVLLLYFLPTYALVAGLMITLGSMVEDLQQGQQIAGFVNLIFIVPFFFFVFVFTNPDSPVLVALTLFPTTSFMTVAMRWGVTTIPLWQLVVGWSLTALAAVGLVWVAARVFRVGMLHYGQSLRFSALGGILQGGRGNGQGRAAEAK